ncbi:hypothetical protein KIN20_000213 [Parelaphostrongylus tenuis]|uniref:Uncharacterized protein n=1 Tax=Parelaphostrongylus tenuis TaxID=148309 RepID=A0AAD5MAX3_PARTN|nr:hypothetical protein KIN20_000213 [Parelaphostrongylus tenuis]
MDRSLRPLAGRLAGKDVMPRRTVVIANAPKRVHYLAYLLYFMVWTMHILPGNYVDLMSNFVKSIRQGAGSTTFPILYCNLLERYNGAIFKITMESDLSSVMRLS